MRDPFASGDDQRSVRFHLQCIRIHPIAFLVGRAQGPYMIRETTYRD